MSPQTTIKQMDGLPAGEIYLAIAQSEQKVAGLMEQKLKEHGQVIEHRLDTQDEKLEAMQSDLTALVGTEKVPGLINRNTELLQGLVDKHETWHEQDTLFRSSITDQVAQLQESHQRVVRDVRAIKWLVSVCTAIARTTSKTFTAAKESRTAKSAGLGAIIWIAIVQFWHVVWPVITRWLHGGSR
jgi:hypothetical protein